MPNILASAILATSSLLMFGGSPSISSEKDHARLFLPTDTMDWKPAASLPKGATMVVLEGDPSKEGPFVFRIKFPDGFKVPVHWHSKPERVTVISGILCFGMGEKFDASNVKEMKAGSYGQWPAGMKHFGFVKGETIIQLHGTGPWTINYVNPADDPRVQK